MVTRLNQATIAFLGLVLSFSLEARAVDKYTLVPTTGTIPWSSAASWTPDPGNAGGSPLYPNGVGAEAILLPNQTTLRSVVLGSEDITIGTLSIHNDLDKTGTNTLNNTIGDNSSTFKLIFDAVGSGPAVINRTGNTLGNGANLEVVRGNVVLKDDLVLNVDLANNQADKIVLNFIQINGTNTFTEDPSTPGRSIIKNGPGTAAFADTDKKFSGSLIINNGRIRLNAAASFNETTAIQINSGGQLVNEKVGAGAAGTLPYGIPTAVITLNGSGLAAFPGALRSGSSAGAGDQTIVNPVSLQSNTAINVVKSSDAANARMLLTGIVSGPGVLTVNQRPGLPNRAGTLVLDNTNTYAGGTVVEQGTLFLSTTNSRAGAGTVFVSGNITNADPSLTTTGRLLIDASVTNGIANTAYLNLSGGGAADTPDQGYADLGGSINEVIGGLMLGNTIIPAGNYGNTSSAATDNGILSGLGLNPNEFFAGTGTVTVTPAGVPGDYNNNGTVDAADYTLWRKGGNLANDFTPGNQPSDYDFWRSRFDKTTNPGSGSSLANSAVPEPSSIGLLVFAASSLIVPGRRRIVPAK